MLSSFQHIRSNPGKLIPYIIIIYIVGVVGLSLPVTEPYFLLMVPANLLLAAALILFFHQEHSIRFYIYSLTVALAGYFIEWLGITTGVIFGEYHYEHTLGPLIAGVPPMMGLNWFIMIYTSGTIVNGIPTNWLVKSLLAAGLMTGYDIILEPNAIHFDFWEWHTDTVPFRNYLAWFSIAWLMFIPFFLLRIQSGKNLMAKALFWIQMAFFLTLWLINNLFS